MTHAVVLIGAERGAISTLGGKLADVEGVAEAYSVTGEWDFVAILRVRNPGGGRAGRDPPLRRHRRHRAHADDGRVRGLLPARSRSALLDRELDRSWPRCVAPEHRPTLREELAPLPRPARWAVLGVLGLLVLGAAPCCSCGSPEEGAQRIVRERADRVQPAPPAAMQRDPPARGECGAPRAQGPGLVRRRAAAPARLRGDVGGVLPVSRRARARRAQAPLPGRSSWSRRARPASTRSRATRSSSARAASHGSTAGSCCCRRPVARRARRREAAAARDPRRAAPTRRATSAPAAQLEDARTAASASGPRARDRRDRLRPVPRGRHARRPDHQRRGLPGGPQAGLEAHDRLRRGDRRQALLGPGHRTTPARNSRAGGSSPS